MKLLLLATLLPSVLCADLAKPRPEGKEQLIPLHPPSLQTDCGYAIRFEDIFTNSKIYFGFFGGVPNGYVHSIGLLGLLSLSAVPVEMIYKILDKADPILDYPALNQALLTLPADPLLNSWGNHFASPCKVTIRECLSDKAFFKLVLDEYNRETEGYLSSTFSKIITVAKLNLPPKNHNSSNSSSGQYIEVASEFTVNEYLSILNDYLFCPFYSESETFVTLTFL